MSTAKWSTPSSETNIAGTALNSLSNGSTSAVMAYDNSSNLDLYARIVVVLGSITPTAGASIILRYVGQRSAVYEDIDTTLDTYIRYVSTGTGVKTMMFQQIRLYPFSDGLVIQNNTGVTLAGSGNAVYIIPFNEQVI